MKNKLIMSIFISFSLSGCFSSNDYFIRFWNDGFVCDRKCKEKHEKIQQKRDEYYEKESQEMKSLRNYNGILCKTLSNKKYSNDKTRVIGGVEYWDFYSKCMKDRKTPLIDYNIEKGEYYEM